MNFLFKTVVHMSSKGGQRNMSASAYFNYETRHFV